jgi:tetratricopeptide (TPR) repeat protein
MRAALHERYAGWLQEHGQLLVEQDEILGFHLERAARFKQELREADPELEQRAGDRLAAAGRRALARGDSRAARGLLARSLALTRATRLDIELELDLCESEYLRSPESAGEIAESAAERALSLGDRAGEAVARVVAADFRSHVTVESRVKEVEELALRALPLLEDVGNDAGLARVWAALGGIANLRGRYEEALRSAEKVLFHSRRVGRPRTALLLLEYALVYGPRPADEGLLVLDAALPGTSHPGPLLHRSLLLGMLGRLDEAWLTARESSERAQALTGNNQAQFLAQIATFEGDHAAAAEHYRDHYRLLERHGARAALSTAAPLLGRSLCALGRCQEAEPLAQLGRELGDPSDVVTQALWRQVEARVLVADGKAGAAETLAREAVELSDRTDGLNMQGDALCDLAEVLACAGANDAAASALEQALQRYERKKNLAMVAQVRPRLEDLREKAPA